MEHLCSAREKEKNVPVISYEQALGDSREEEPLSKREKTSGSTKVGEGQLPVVGWEEREAIKERDRKTVDSNMKKAQTTWEGNNKVFDTQ